MVSAYVSVQLPGKTAFTLNVLSLQLRVPPSAGGDPEGEPPVPRKSFFLLFVHCPYPPVQNIRSHAKRFSYFFDAAFTIYNQIYSIDLKLSIIFFT